MIRLGFFFVALLAIATGAAAQERNVRSDNHSTFARFTLPLDAQETWTADRTEDGITVTIANHTGGFNISEVFFRVPRNRVNSIEANSSSLSFSFVCDCGATAFRSANLLVIDVVDPGFPLAGPSISRKGPQTADSAWQPKKSILPWIGSTPPHSGEQAPTDQIAMGEKAENALEEHNVLLHEMQERLTNGFAAAATMGLLDSSYEAPDVSARFQHDTTQSKPTAPAQLPDALLVPQNNMRISSGMDKPAAPHTSANSATGAGVTCPADSLVSVESWGNDSDFAVQIGLARTALVDARDRLDKTAVVDLTKLYIYFGFGAEALEVLHLDRTLVKKNAHLAAIATILERGAIIGSNPLKPYTDCSSDMALWASLSFGELPDGLLIDTKAALRALNKLPQHLRQIIAPQLSDRFLQYGEPQAAAAALRSVERLPDGMTPDGVMAQAALAMNTGAPADDKLETVIGTNTEKSPAALITLVESKLNRDEPIPYETAKLVEAYAQELRGTEMGNRLRKTQVVALSQAAHFDEAFNALEALAPAISEKHSQGLRQTVVEQLTKKASDVVFLDHYFRQDSGALTTLASEVQLALAARLMELGFAAQVQTLLDRVPDRPRNSMRQLIAARAAIALQQPYKAQAALVGLEEPAASMLLAQAKQMTGSYTEAAQIFADLDAPEQATEAAWLSEDWQGLIRPDIPEFGPVAARASAGGAIADPEAGPLGRADSALEESRAMRESLSDLLSAPAMQIELDP